jgi:D-sedoheptulose 7-phosphate isomerase
MRGKIRPSFAGKTFLERFTLMKNSARKHFQDISEYCANVGEVLRKIPFTNIELVIQALMQAHAAGRSVFVFGNGGSAALASHMACDLGKGMVDVTPKRNRVLALTDNVPLLTAWANDVNYDQVFSEQLRSLLQPNDIALAISSSGNSANVLSALRVAKALGALTIGLTGFDGGKARPLCDLCIVVPCDNTQIIEDAHTILAHGMFSVLRTRLQLASMAGAQLARLHSRAATAN